MNSYALISRDKSSKMLYDVAGIIGGGLLAFLNIFAWTQDFNAGVEATKITVLGVALIGLAAHAISTLGRSWTAFTVENMKKRSEAQAENEKLHKDSYESKLNELLKRVNDANHKLHDANNRENVQVLKHAEEAERLTQQLDIMSRHLNEALDELKFERQENRELSESFEKLRTENILLVNKVEDLKTQLCRKMESVENKVEKNNELINEFADDHKEQK